MARTLLITPTILLTALLALALVMAGCDSADPAQETGTVTGTVLAPDGVTPVGGATVTLEGAQLVRTGPAMEVAALNAPQTFTDADGNFVLEGVPVGDQTLTARRGLFQVSIPVVVEAGTVTEAPPASLEQEGQFAAIPGAYDNMQSIGGEMGVDIDVVNADIFADLAAVSEYGMVFLNCATQIAAGNRDNALAYMMDGGTLYVSDLSGTTASALIDGLQTSGGGSVQTIEATVVFDELETAIGRSEVSIQYNAGGWHLINELPATDTQVLLEGTRAGQDEPEPLAVVVRVGMGQLVFTTFHNTAGLEEDQRELLRYFVFLGGQPINI